MKFPKEPFEQPRLTVDMLRRIHVLYSEGRTVEQIAEDFYVPQSYVRRVLRGAGEFGDVRRPWTRADRLARLARDIQAAMQASGGTTHAIRF